MAGLQTQRHGLGSWRSDMKTIILSFAVLAWAWGPARGASPQDSCVTCHSELEGGQEEPVRLFEGDIHHQAGLGCADCHGGDPKDESMDAMSRAKGFRGAPKKTQVPNFCARCHSDIAYMRRFNPKMRADQL